MSAHFEVETTDAGAQSLVPGVRPVTARERLERRMAEPLGSPRPQKPLNIGLFDADARHQLEMFGPSGRVRESLPPRGG